MTHSVFYLGIAFILLHEMDAMRCREWRIFPGLSLLSDKTGMITFLLLHIPLFYWLALEMSRVAPTFITGFNIFLIIHLLLHLLFLWHPKNEFKDWISWSIIIGAASCGAIDLWIG